MQMACLLAPSSTFCPVMLGFKLCKPHLGFVNRRVGGDFRDRGGKRDLLLPICIT